MEKEKGMKIAIIVLSIAFVISFILFSVFTLKYIYDKKNPPAEKVEQEVVDEPVKPAEPVEPQEPVQVVTPVEDKNEKDDYHLGDELDFERLGVERYEYPKKDDFVMTDDLERVLTVMANKDCWDSTSSIREGDWEGEYLRHIICNGLFSFDYLNEITKDEKHISLEELQYIHYSLTGEMKNFATVGEDGYDVKRDINIFSGLSHMEAYTYQYDCGDVQIQALVKFTYTHSLGGELYTDESYEKVTYFLEKNPYSCFGGYSISRIVSYAGDRVYDGYKNVLSNPKSFPWGDCFFEYNWDNYVLEDLDGDGIKELIATCKSPERRDAGMQYYMIVGHNENGLVITQISDGVASAGGYRGEKYYIPGKGILYDRAVWAPNGDSSDKILEFKNGLLEEKAYGRFDRNMDKPETGTWTWDEVLMSEEDYNKKLEAATENLSGKLLSEMPYKDKNSILKELDELMKRK